MRARRELLQDHHGASGQTGEFQGSWRIRAAAGKSPPPRQAARYDLSTERTAGPIDSVLLIGFGGPTGPEQVMPFLARVTEGRGIPEERLRETAQHYAMVGGRSPYTQQTRQLASSVAAWLSNHQTPIPVHIGMRNWHPFLRDTIADMTGAGLRHAAGVILAAHRSEAS